jgi:hypothetical protein
VLCKLIAGVSVGELHTKLSHEWGLSVSVRADVRPIPHPKQSPWCTLSNQDSWMTDWDPNVASWMTDWDPNVDSGLCLFQWASWATV